MKNLSVIISLILLLTISACGPANRDIHKQEAQRMAHPALMIERIVAAPPYAITTFERMHERHAPAHIYIGNDYGHYDIGLHLASRDKAENVASIALPCHYTETLENEECTDQSADNQAAFASAINQTIDNTKRTYDLTDIHLIGYGSGANIAARIAGARHDVRSLRSVSALFEHGAYTIPEDAYKVLQHIPQHHYVDLDEDGAITSSLKIYQSKLGKDYCQNTTTVLETENKRGWTNRWSELISQPVTCRYDATDYRLMDVDYITPRPAPPKTGWLPDSHKEKP